MFKNIFPVLAAMACALTFSSAATEQALAQTNPASAYPLIELGKPAPPLSLRGVLNADGNTTIDLAKLRGKVVVLEFWATNCVPCVQNIPHLNEMRAKLPKNQVQFIAIDREPMPVQERFLKANPINAWIGIDDGRTAMSYQARAIPKTVIIDRQGNVASISHPRSVEVASIQNIFEGKPSGIKQIFVHPVVAPQQ